LCCHAGANGRFVKVFSSHSGKSLFTFDIARAFAVANSVPDNLLSAFRRGEI